jgi:hypothetical protein
MQRGEFLDKLTDYQRVKNEGYIELRNAACNQSCGKPGLNCVFFTNTEIFTRKEKEKTWKGTSERMFSESEIITMAMCTSYW